MHVGCALRTVYISLLLSFTDTISMFDDVKICTQEVLTYEAPMKFWTMKPLPTYPGVELCYINPDL